MDGGGLAFARAVERHPGRASPNGSAWRVRCSSWARPRGAARARAVAPGPARRGARDAAVPGGPRELESGNPNLALGLLREAPRWTATRRTPSRASRRRSPWRRRWRAQPLPEANRAFGGRSAAPARTAPTCCTRRRTRSSRARSSPGRRDAGDVVSDPTYPHRAEALADLADIRLKGGVRHRRAARAPGAGDGRHGGRLPVPGQRRLRVLPPRRGHQLVRAGGERQPGRRSGLGNAQQLLADAYAWRGEERPSGSSPTHAWPSSTPTPQRLVPAVAPAPAAAQACWAARPAAQLAASVARPWRDCCWPRRWARSTATAGGAGRGAS